MSASLIEIPNSEGVGTGACTAAAFLAEAASHPVYGIATFTTVAEVLPYLQALANALASDLPAMNPVTNKMASDTRCQTLLAEIILAAGG
jgi:hypothetical protein